MHSSIDVSLIFSSWYFLLLPPKLSIFRFCFRRNFHAWLGEASKKSRKILRQLLNHVICLLKAHFASLCVTSASTYVEANEGKSGEGSRCRNCKAGKRFPMWRAVRLEPARNAFPTHIDSVNFLVLKKWDVRDEERIKQTQAEKHTESSKHQQRNQERKFCFLNTNFTPQVFPLID